MKKLDVVYENKTTLINLEIQHTLSHLPHMHKELELIYVLEGNCVAVADRGRFNISKGDIYLAFPNQVHYYEQCTRGDYLVLIFSYDVIPYLSKTVRENIPENNSIKIASNGNAKRYCEALTELSHTDRHTEMCGYTNLLLGAIIPEMTLLSHTVSDSSSLRNILNYCSANYMNNPTLDDASQTLHLSKYHISHLLNGRLNLSFTDYLNSLRIDAACDALADTEKRIADISEDVGFGTIRSFNRTFKGIMGIAPQEYRKKHQEKS